MRKRSQAKNANSITKEEVKTGIILTVIVCFILMGVTIHGALQSSKSQEEATVHVLSATSKVSSPTPQPSPSPTPILSPSSSPTLSPSPSPTPAPSPSPEALKVSSLKEITVLKNDNFWDISKRACGSGKYYKKIKEDSGFNNKTLKPGLKIKIDCAKYAV